MKKYKIANVHWIDASYYRGEGDISWYTKNASGMKSQTTGFVFRKDKSNIVIAQELFEDDTARNIIVIPRKMVTKIEYLKEVK